MKKVFKAIQCRDCGYIMPMSSALQYCPKCSNPTGRLILAKKAELSIEDVYIGNYSISYNPINVKSVMARYNLFGKIKYVKDIKEV